MKETEIVMAQQTPSFFGPQLILLIGFVAIMYFLIIRPQNNRLIAQKVMIESLSVGDEVIASGGMVCVITKMKNLLLKKIIFKLEIQKENFPGRLQKECIQKN